MVAGDSEILSAPAKNLERLSTITIPLAGRTVLDPSIRPRKGSLRMTRRYEVGSVFALGSEGAVFLEEPVGAPSKPDGADEGEE